MSAIFEIFDFDNDGMFGLDDLITLLRTFEKSEIIPQLSNLRIKHIGGSSTEESSKSNDSDEYSNKSIEKLNDSNQLNETLHRKNMFYFDSVVWVILFIILKYQKMKIKASIFWLKKGYFNWKILISYAN